MDTVVEAATLRRHSARRRSVRSGYLPEEARRECAAAVRKHRDSTRAHTYLKQRSREEHLGMQQASASGGSGVRQCKPTHAAILERQQLFDVCVEPREVLPCACVNGCVCVLRYM